MADITALCERVLMIHHGQLIYDGSLDGLVDRFSPCREVKVEFNRTYTEAELSAYGYVQEIDKQSVRLLVEQEELTQAIAKILAELQVVDLAVTEPPIEEVIGRVFQAGAVN